MIWPSFSTTTGRTPTHARLRLPRVIGKRRGFFTRNAGRHLFDGRLFHGRGRWGGWTAQLWHDNDQSDSHRACSGSCREDVVGMIGQPQPHFLPWIWMWCRFCVGSVLGKSLTASARGVLHLSQIRLWIRNSGQYLEGILFRAVHSRSFSSLRALWICQETVTSLHCMIFAASAWLNSSA